MEEKKKNWRDVGVALALLQKDSADKKVYLKPNKIFRCGLVDFCTHQELGSPGTILNLRMGEDTKTFDEAVWEHIGASNSLDKYHTEEGLVRVWLIKVMKLFENPNTKFPILIHCRSGKDRTGVVVAALLAMLDVPRDLIIKEFLLSKGAKEENLQISLDGFSGKAKKTKQNSKWQGKKKQGKSSESLAPPTIGSAEMTQYFRKKVSIKKICTVLQQ
eukprot:TRINITY_DN2213_c0_g2_i3.p1 TRINITY_DN2213_c0_g2~~TRINITY_DN2213_c0_g2_i3.p1  ORF type:complete len:217 (+),score=42.98 TRINITY_DN2213_c0_g2_i3:955-1605(+)